MTRSSQKILGLIGGLSWESTAVYYRLLNQGVRQRLGGLHSARLLVWSFDFETIAAAQAADDWDRATAEMVAAAERLARAGADGLVICANTMHRVADEVAAAAGRPVIHIVDATAAALRAAGVRRPLLLATRYTMEQDFYTGRLADRHGITAVTPPEPARGEVHRIIYDELCCGEIVPASKARAVEMIADAAAGGADAVILGCTELGLLLGPGDAALPMFDSAQLHADAAISFALG